MKSSHLASLVAVCACASVATAQIIGQDNKNLPFTTITSGPRSNVKEQGIAVLNTQQSLDRYWSRVMNQDPDTAPQDIDFILNKVVVVHLGRRDTGGYKFIVRNLEQGRGGLVIIRAIETPPGRRQNVTQAQTSPWVMIRVPYTMQNFRLSVTDREPENVATPRRGGRCTCTDCGCDCGCGN